MQPDTLGRPVRLNVFLLCAASIANAALLYTASHAASVWVMVGAAVLFSFTCNTVFSLLHECVHGLFSRHPGLNRLAGWVAAAWFPTSLSVQQAYHLTHHRYNRSPAEQFDVLHAEDVRWLKYAQWYAIFTGLYWFVALLGLLLYATTPCWLRNWLIRLAGNQAGLQTSASHYGEALNQLPPLQSRMEIGAALAFQLALFYGLQLNGAGWLLCYGLFAIHWSSLQYTDHAFSPLDRRNGAWNLRVPRLVRLVFLNYHLHLAHHQHPDWPWTELPRKAEDGPSFLDVWLACWRGPRAPQDFPVFRRRSVL